MNYYSIHGSDKDGWTLVVYEEKPGGFLTTYQTKPKEFPKLRNLLEEIVGNGDIDVENQSEVQEAAPGSRDPEVREGT